MKRIVVDTLLVLQKTIQQQGHACYSANYDYNSDNDNDNDDSNNTDRFNEFCVE